MSAEWDSLLNKPPILALIQLERFVSFRYVVSPVDGRTSYETREFPEGNPQRAVHVTFTAGSIGNGAAGQVAKMCEQIWNEMLKQFPINAHVVWRVRPKLEPLDKGLRVYCRLGAFKDEEKEAVA